MKLSNVVAAVALAASVPSALAESIETTVQLLPSAGSFSAAFGANKTESGLFVDSFAFELPGATAGGVSVTFGTLTPNLELVVATLASPDGNRFAQSPEDGIAQGTVLSLVDAVGSLTLTVLGTAGDAFAAPSAITASYGGTILFAPGRTGTGGGAGGGTVPVPATVALLLAGLAGIGLVPRRRATAR